MTDNPESFKAKFFKRIMIILVAALFMRTLGLVSRPIWYDEAFSILFAEKGPDKMLYGTLATEGTGSAEEHPLGYYIILWAWVNIFGTTVVSARALSIIAGLGVVYLIYKIALELFDRKVAALAAWILVFAPFQVHYAMEIRMYSFLAFWLLLAVYFYLKGSKTGDRKWWLGFAIASAAAQYTHNLAVFFLVPLAVTPLFKRDWKNLPSVIYAGSLSLLFYLPWLTQLPAQFAKVDQSYWIVKPDISRFFTLLLFFTTNIPLPSKWILPGLVVAVSMVTIGLLQTFRTRSTETSANGRWIFYLSFIPPVLLFLFSQWIPVYVERALLPSGAIFCIWLAWIISKTDLSILGQRIMYSMLTFAFAIGIYQHVTYLGFPYGPFEEINSYIEDHKRTGDLIIHSSKLSYLPAFYFDPQIDQSYISDPPGSKTDTLAPATREILHALFQPDIETAIQGNDRVWYIIFQQSIDEYIESGRSTHSDIEYLNMKFDLLSENQWGDLIVLEYARRK